VRATVLFVWNLSVMGLRLSGDVPMQVGQTYSVTVHLPNQERIFVATMIVRWNRGQEYGLEAFAIDTRTQSRLEEAPHN
jgi:PilZ domain